MTAAQQTSTADRTRACELLLDAPDPHRPATDRYQLTIAHDAAEVTAAQRLRHEVFAGELGALTPGPVGLDADPFDERCDHLVVWHTSGDRPDERRAVATYRLLPPHANDVVPAAAGLYSASEFDLTPLEPLLGRTVEAGRSCVHPDHRSGTAVSLLWGGIARYLHLSGHRYLLGCGSVPLGDGGATAAAFADLVAQRHLAPTEQRCRPHRPFDPSGIPRPARPVLPPLLKGYLRLGAVVCGPPALDVEFGTADFLVLLDLEAADQRYLRYFLGGAR